MGREVRGACAVACCACAVVAMVSACAAVGLALGAWAGFAALSGASLACCVGLGRMVAGGNGKGPGD